MITNEKKMNRFSNFLLALLFLILIVVASYRIYDGLNIKRMIFDENIVKVKIIIESKQEKENDQNKVFTFENEISIKKLLQLRNRLRKRTLRDEKRPKELEDNYVNIYYTIFQQAGKEEYEDFYDVEKSLVVKEIFNLEEVKKERLPILKIQDEKVDYIKISNPYVKRAITIYKDVNDSRLTQFFDITNKNDYNVEYSKVQIEKEILDNKYKCKVQIDKKTNSATNIIDLLNRNKEKKQVLSKKQECVSNYAASEYTNNSLIGMLLESLKKYSLKKDIDDDSENIMLEVETSEEGKISSFPIYSRDFATIKLLNMIDKDIFITDLEIEDMTLTKGKRTVVVTDFEKILEVLYLINFKAQKDDKKGSIKVSYDITNKYNNQLIENINNQLLEKGEIIDSNTRGNFETNSEIITKSVEMSNEKKHYNALLLRENMTDDLYQLFE